ncbi:MAG: Ig-like domain-containing protein [Verrucomicrobia bacterium]|nr:Ig-like domain-containing protein [Verrucomicrobiota bacterium]
MLDPFRFGDPVPQTLTITGLTPGQTYDARIYYREWVGPFNRSTLITFDEDGAGPLSTSVTVNQDATPEAFYLSYVFTATNAPLSVSFAGTAGNTGASFHLSGFSVQTAIPSGQPALTTLNPANNATGVNVSTNLVATFNEPIIIGTGNITLKNLTDGTQTTIAVTDTTQVSISGAVLTISPTADLLAGKNYAIQIAATAIKDLANNAFVGISDDATWNFATAAASGSYQAGLWYGTVTGNINTTDANPTTSVTVDLSQTEASIADNTTEIYTGQIYDADGQIAFTEDIDDKTRLYIDGTLVLSSDNWDDRVSTGNLNLTPGWHEFELRISNGTGGSGPHTSPGFGYDPNGGTNWMHPSDPGDGSLFRSALPGGMAPVISSSSPVDNATGVAVTANLVATFSTPIARGTGNITIKNLTDGTNTTIPITDTAQVSISGAVLTINPTANLAVGKNHAIQIDASAIDDTAGTNFAGISDDTTWNFATVASDTTAPTVTNRNPADNAAGVAVDANLVATFSEPIVSGTGNITLRTTSNNQVVATMAVTDTAQVSISGNILTINPTADLLGGTSYAVRIAATCIDDTAGNSFAGIANNTTWNFTTETPDTTAPTPNPMTFASPPTAAGTTSITMTATTGSDPSGVEYFFECTAGGGHSSAWQDSPTYTDAGLTAATQYSYRVRARDKSAAQTATAWSAAASATTPNTPYGTWSGGAAFDGDANHDGVDNGMAWLLGAADSSENAAGKLPKATRNGTNLRLTFRCLKSTERGGVVLKVQSSSDLGLAAPWTNHEAAVPDADATVNGVVFDTTADGDFIHVIADIPAPGSAKLFARLRAVNAP